MHIRKPIIDIISMSKSPIRGSCFLKVVIGSGDGDGDVRESLGLLMFSLYCCLFQRCKDATAALLREENKVT